VLYFISLTFLIILALFYTAPAFAACTSPAGVAGTLEWFSGTSEYKICDGTNWDVIELDSVSLGACSPIANREWDATLKAYKICDASGDYKRINCIEDGLVGHWKFNEASGPTAVDHHRAAMTAPMPTARRRRPGSITTRSNSAANWGRTRRTTAWP
jgi:hypothetical protein